MGRGEERGRVKGEERKRERKKHEKKGLGIEVQRMPTLNKRPGWGARSSSRKGKKNTLRAISQNMGVEIVLRRKWSMQNQNNSFLNITNFKRKAYTWNCNLTYISHCLPFQERKLLILSWTVIHVLVFWGSINFLNFNKNEHCSINYLTTTLKLYG